jgi:hypothetical protein
LFIAGLGTTAIAGVPTGGFACLPPLPPPQELSVRQTGNQVTIAWQPGPTAPHSSGFRVEVGRRAGSADLATVDVPLSETTLAGAVPPGSYVARVRTLAGALMSMPTPEVSFAVGPPDVPAAPLDLTVVVAGVNLRMTWRPPSTGNPASYVLQFGTGPGQSNLATIALAGDAAQFDIEAPPGRYMARLVAVNAAGSGEPSNEVVVDVDYTAWLCRTAPLAPFDLQASVAGRRVTLTWRQPITGALANEQRLFAGRSPGATDIGVFGIPGPVTRFSADTPPGTYFARLAGFNGCGPSPYSNEVRVVVP